MVAANFHGSRRGVTVLPWFFILALISGCGEKSPFTRHEVRGTVKYGGQDVEFGTIIFEPTESVGKLAPVAYAEIRNGVFQTTTEDGPIAGRYHARVLGFDRTGLPEGDPNHEAKHLFPEYNLDIDIPVDGELTIEVPARRR